MLLSGSNPRTANGIRLTPDRKTAKHPEEIRMKQAMARSGKTARQIELDLHFLLPSHQNNPKLQTSEKSFIAILFFHELHFEFRIVITIVLFNFLFVGSKRN